MAVIRFPGGPGGVRLAGLVAEHNPGVVWREAPAVGTPSGTAPGGGLPPGIELEGHRVEVHRSMVEQAYWPAGGSDPHSAERFLRYLVRVEARTVQVLSADRLVVADEFEVEQALLVRFPGALKERLAQTAERLGLSQNELVIRAVEDVIRFVEEFEGSAGNV